MQSEQHMHQVNAWHLCCCRLFSHDASLKGNADGGVTPLGRLISLIKDVLVMGALSGVPVIKQHSTLHIETNNKNSPLYSQN